MWNMDAPGFWWALTGTVFLYYLIVSAVLYGRGVKERLQKLVAGSPAQEATDRWDTVELARAFEEYGKIIRQIDSPRFRKGKLLVPSHIQVNLLSKPPYSVAVEREG